MMATVYGHYSQTELDWQYNNRQKVADAQAWLTRYRQWSDTLKNERPDGQRLAFGPGSSDYVDVFPGQAANAPIHVFFHGGYWKSLAAEDFAFVTRAAPGALTIVAEYPLVPTVSLERLLTHCRAALGWIWQQAATLGGDRQRLVISGHSAGGHIVGHLLTTAWQTPEPDSPPPVLSAAIALSGLYDLEPIRRSFLNEDLGLNSATVAHASPLAHPPTSQAALWLAVGSDEGPEYLCHSRRMADHWRNHGLSPGLWELPATHHFDIVAQFADPTSSLSRLLQQTLSLEKP